jgi:hypothetical protein
MNNKLLIFPSTSVPYDKYLYVFCHYFHMFGMIWRRVLLHLLSSLIAALFS